jgi:hypothetical protein
MVLVVVSQMVDVEVIHEIGSNIVMDVLLMIEVLDCLGLAGGTLGHESFMEGQLTRVNMMYFIKYSWVIIGLINHLLLMSLPP